MKSKLFLILIFSCSIARAEDTPDTKSDRPDFNQHLAGNPNAVGHLKFNYEPFPGQHFRRRSIFFSTFAVGLGDKIEVGVIPTSYLMTLAIPRIHLRNITLKYNFYRDNELSVALGYALLYHEESFSDNNYYRSYTHGISIISAYALADRFSLGLNISSSIYRIEASAPSKIDPTIEEYIDLCYRAFQKVAITVGASHTQSTSEDGFGPTYYELGFGSTLTWYRPGSFLSKPAFGFHYLTGSRKPLWLLSTTFY